MIKQCNSNIARTRISEELQIEESKIREIIEKGNILYKEFYN